MGFSRRSTDPTVPAVPSIDGTAYGPVACGHGSAGVVLHRGGAHRASRGTDRCRPTPIAARLLP